MRGQERSDERHHGYPVVDDHHGVVGMVTRGDVLNWATDPPSGTLGDVIATRWSRVSRMSRWDVSPIAWRWPPWAAPLSWIPTAASSDSSPGGTSSGPGSSSGPESSRVSGCCGHHGPGGGRRTGACSGNGHRSRKETTS